MECHLCTNSQYAGKSDYSPELKNQYPQKWRVKDGWSSMWQAFPKSTT